MTSEQVCAVPAVTTGVLVVEAKGATGGPGSKDDPSSTAAGDLGGGG